MRRLFLMFVVIPPVASVGAAIGGVLSVEASTAVMATAVLALLAVLLDVTLQAQADKRHELRAYKNDDQAVPHLIRHIEDERPKTVDLLEYSAFGAMGFLAAIAHVGSTRAVRLLVAHPDAAISDYQREFRLAEGLRLLAYRIPADRAQEIGLQIKCYSDTASVRGRLLDGRSLMIGWYSYDDRGLADPGGRPISGGSNALVSVDADSTGGQYLTGMYSRVFENLWRDASQPDDAWEPYRARFPHLPKPEWFKAVRAHE